MSDPLPLPARRILDTLLDRYEQPKRLRVVRVRLAADTDGDYFSAHDAAPRRQTNDALKALAERGVLRLRWQRWEEDNWLEAVDLVAERAHELYGQLGRARHADQSDALLKTLEAQSPRPGWHAVFLAHTKDLLRARRSVAPLVLDDARWNHDLLRALDTVARLERPSLERTLSVQLFNDSKRLAELRGAVLSVLRRHDPDAPGYASDEWALLRAHHLERVPEYVPLAGSLRLRAGAAGLTGPLLDLSPFQPSVALSAATLQDATIESCGATTVVSVENATSFSELAAIRPGSLLVIYTGGFASPAVTTFLCRLRAYQPLLRFFHWGDLDAGGFRILAHLRRAAGVITPIAMDAATFDAFQKHAQSLTAADTAALHGLQSHPLLADCGPVLAHLIAAGQKLEQEAVDAGEVVRRL